MILHSQIIGKGNPFIILHGFLGMSDNWKTLGNKFAEIGFEVHLVDQRNHGRSFHSDEFSYKDMSDDLMKYCQEKNLRNIILLGHSMGGKTAMEFAVSHSDMCSKLIVADIAPKFYPQHHQDILKALSSLDFDEIQSRQDAEFVLSKFIPEKSVRMFLLKNLYRKNKEKFGLRMNLPVLKREIEEVGKSLSDDVIFEKDTLFIRGGNSGYIEDFDAVLIRRHFPSSIIRTIPHVGHWLHAENPEEFFRICKDFIEE